ncbi:Similar to Uncharacterized protein C1071.11; acc. no. Q9UTQ4 [Pyronema omphalodes CBS 100304]|uniref:Similar to Uncharacterized protein C1071.11 acc. no. Q9UTQ4 n=1 Tax=Pyronema omphalodes (strain CBS 100304) TaxID=1076935 RepID=U4LMH2_PYROM|nr:Similar to Uncharacterized protein C1071.11; acc. no. Q9UTQ4 [Pyronema omphalodes CBS 100304]
MRSLPHPVIILTTPPLPSSSDTTGPAHDPTGHGITLSTLTCLSLAPYPLVSFNIKTPSRTSLSLHNSGRFCIHVMSSSPHSAHVANIFAQLAASHTTKQSPWEKLRGKTEVVDGVPTMGREDGVLSRWSVVTEKYVDVQDHEVWVGRVVGVEELAGEEGKGLMYQNRRFRNVGEEVVPEFGGMGEGVAKIDVEAEAREAAGGRYKGVVSDYVNGSEF